MQALFARIRWRLVGWNMLILGLILGLLRKRAGTTAAIIAHTGYDMILLVLSLYIH